MRIQNDRYGHILWLVVCTAVILGTKVALYPSLTTAVRPLGDGGINFIRCALIGEFPVVMLYPDAGYLPLLPRVLVELLTPVVTAVYLPAAFYAVSLILAALACSSLVLPVFARIIPSLALRIVAALFIGTFPDYLSNLPENIGIFSLIPLIGLWLWISEEMKWRTVALAAALGSVLMISKPYVVTIAPIFALTGLFALWRGKPKTATVNGIIAAAAGVQCVYMLGMRLTQNIWQTGAGLSPVDLLKQSGHDFLALTANWVTAGSITDGPTAITIGVVVFAVIAIGMALTIRTKDRPELSWIIAAVALMILGTIVINAFTGLRFSGQTRNGLAIVIALVVATSALQPSRSHRPARMLNLFLVCIFSIGTLVNIAHSHDDVAATKGYADWQKTYFLAQHDVFSIPIDSPNADGAVWLLQNKVSFLNSDATPWLGKPLPVGNEPAANFPIDLTTYNGTNVLGAIVPLTADQVGKPIEMRVVDRAGEQHLASMSVPLPNNNRYFLLDRPIADVDGLRFSISGTPENVDPAIILIGAQSGRPRALQTCNILTLFH